MYIKVCLYGNNQWHGFTQQQGHLYGKDTDNQWFIATGKTDASGRFLVYRCTQTKDLYKWYVTSEPFASPLNVLIMEGLRKREALGIQGVGTDIPVTAIYNPEITSDKPYPYTPMRIWGGSRAKNFIPGESRARYRRFS